MYLDDVVLLGRSFEEHLRNLHNAGLELHPSKCSFSCKQVSFFGNIVFYAGVATDSAKTKSGKLDGTDIHQ